MTWSAPMTAVANTIFTAAQFNQYVRDNLNETAPAKAVSSGQYFVANGPNAIGTRKSFNDIVAGAESTASTTYTDLATTGPAVSVLSGPTVLVLISVGISTDTNNSAAFAGYGITGATSRAATDAEACEMDGITLGNSMRYTIASHATGLTPGVNTFTMKYRAGSNTATYSNRQIICVPW